MAMSLSTRSTIVAGLKVALPLVALGLLSTLFLVSRSVDPEDAVTRATVDIEDRLREPRLTDATYAGVTEDGASMTVSAAEARPPQQGGLAGSATTLRAVLDLPGGNRTELLAGEGRIDQSAQRLFLSGGVTVTMQDGTRIAAPEMTARLDQTGLETSGGAVRASGAFGTLDAGRMTLAQAPRQADAQPGRYVLDFSGGVRLLYAPQPP